MEICVLITFPVRLRVTPLVEAQTYLGLNYPTAQPRGHELVHKDWNQQWTQHQASWHSYNLDERWEIWNRMAEAALGLPEYSRGGLSLVERRIKPPPLNKQLIAEYKHHQYVLDLYAAVQTGTYINSLDWPALLGMHPTTTEQQVQAIEHYLHLSHNQQQRDKRKGWQTWVHTHWRNKKTSAIQMDPRRMLGLGPGCQERYRSMGKHAT